MNEDQTEDIHVHVRLHLGQIGSIAYVARELALALHQRGAVVKISDIATDWNRAPSLAAVTLPGQEATLKRLASRPLDAAELARVSWSHVRYTPEVDLEDRWPGFNYFMLPWDYDPNHLNRELVRDVNCLYDGAWLMSQHTIAAYVNVGLDRAKAYWVPHGVSPEYFHPGVTPLPIETKKSYKFLFVGIPSRRKGIDVLLAAFVEEFSRADDVCLIVKTKPTTFDQREEALRLMNQIRPANEQPEIHFIFDELPLDQLPSLYAACDCFVFPSRGEAFGLSLLEAMACAKPVVATRWSGPTDFCTRENSYLLDYSFSEASNTEHPEFRLPTGTLWAEPDREQLRQILRHIFDHPEEAAAVGRRAHQDVVDGWTWDHVARRVIASLPRTGRVSGT